MTKELNLPGYARSIAPAKIEVDADGFYPEILEELNIDESQITQYWLAAAKAIMKMDIQVAVAGTESAAPENGALTILVRDDTKAAGAGVSKYAQKAYPEGDGANAGARAAREHYRKLRGFVPV